jgi:hypothetical protein
MAKRAVRTATKPLRITRSKAIELLRGLQAEAARTASGHGRIFSATWVAVGDGKQGPYLCHKAIRFQVERHRKGGTLAYSPAQHGYMVVFEMVNRRRALALFKAEGRHKLKELEPQLATAIRSSQDAQSKLAKALLAQTEAQQRLDKAILNTFYMPVKDRNQALKPFKQEKRSADRAHNAAWQNDDRCRRKVEELESKITTETLKATNPEEAIYQLALARMGRLESQLRQETNAAARAVLRAKVAAAHDVLADPVKSLMARYRMLNVKGLTALKINGRQYAITTRPVPRLPRQTTAAA